MPLGAEGVSARTSLQVLCVTVGVGVAVGVSVSVAVGVSVSVAVGVAVSVAVGVAVGVSVDEGVPALFASAFAVSPEVALFVSLDWVGLFLAAVTVALLLGGAGSGGTPQYVRARPRNNVDIIIIRRVVLPS